MEGRLSISGFQIAFYWLKTEIFRRLTWVWTCFSSAFWHQLGAVPPKLPLWFVCAWAFRFSCLALLCGYTSYLLFCPIWVTGSFSSRYSRLNESRWAGSWLINASLTMPIGVLLDFNLSWLTFTGFGKSSQIYIGLELWNCDMQNGNHQPYVTI